MPRVELPLLEVGTPVEADIPIWANKIHRARPVQCDGPIPRFRGYFEHFYADRDPLAAAAE